MATLSYGPRANDPSAERLVFMPALWSAAAGLLCFAWSLGCAWAATRYEGMPLNLTSHGPFYGVWVLGVPATVLTCAVAVVTWVGVAAVNRHGPPLCSLWIILVWVVHVFIWWACCVGLGFVYFAYFFN